MSIADEFAEFNCKKLKISKCKRNKVSTETMSDEGKIHTLVNFFVFDTSRSFSEDEEYKSIVFYYPTDTARDTQMKEVGRTAAILKFSQTFGTSGSCHSLHTRKTRQYFNEPEPGFCMAMTVKLPIVPIDNDIETHDKVFNSLLVHSYHMFRLFMGSMNSALTVAEQPEVELEQLKLRATYFYSKHLQMMPLEDADLADAFLGIQFLPMDKLSFLKVRSLVSHVEQTYPCITSSTVLYQDQIVWTGLCQDDVQLIYNYLTTKLFPASINLSPETRYLTGPSDVHNHSSELRTPHVFLNHSQNAPDECQLVVYRVAGVTICLFVSASIELNHDFFVSLDATLGPRILALSADVAEQALIRKTPSLNIGTDSIRFLYFNQWNMAFKSTLHQSIPGHRRVLQCQPSANNDVIKTCADLCEDFSSFGEGEIVVKTKSDAWVLGKLSNQRHLYVVVTRKNAELVEICDEVRRLRNILFKDILLLE